MNPSIKKLAEIANKRSRRIIGLMSGTSLDGLDIALCKVTGSGAATKVELERFFTAPYQEEQKNRLKKVSSVENVSLGELCYQHTWLSVVHSQMILNTLAEWQIKPDEVDCIASHGQSVYHLPARDLWQTSEKLNSTLQIADGDHIAARTGILTISDFRQKHTAYGGEGAPLAALVDRLLFVNETESVILLNIGGIANFTYLPAGQNKHETSFTTDCGPGNTLIDNVMQKYYQKPFDEDGMTAASGMVHHQLLDALASDEWLKENQSKSTGPEYFNLAWLSERAKQAGIDLAGIDPADLVATVTELSAVTISESITRNIGNQGQPIIYTSGGGAHNPVLAGRLKELLPGSNVKNFLQLGLDPDAKEAVIFAVLANEMLAGSGFSFKAGNKNLQNIHLGKISFPD
ncbi:MAG: anhydro-N-acetylmuramic acid kinase [Balneolaceae bacterium]